MVVVEGHGRMAAAETRGLDLCYFMITLILLTDQILNFLFLKIMNSIFGEVQNPNLKCVWGKTDRKNNVLGENL